MWRGAGAIPAATAIPNLPLPLTPGSRWRWLRRLQGVVHEVEQVLPAVEGDVERERTQVLEEGAPRRQLSAHALVALIAEIKQRMGEKRQQDETGKQVGQMLLAVAVVVLKAIAFGLERIVVLVLDLPAAAPCGDDGDDVVLVQRNGAGPSVAVEHLARGIARGQFAPADLEGIVAVAQWQLIEPANRCASCRS